MPLRLFLLLLSFLLFGSLHVHRGVVAVPLQYQNTDLDFWEPLPFAGGLPIATKPVFWQDSSVYGKILTIGGNIDGSGVFNVTNAVFELDVVTERWRQTAPGGDVFMQRTFHVAVVLENNGVQYVAVYGGVTSHPEVAGLPLPIQDFAVLNLDTFTWENKGMIVDAEQYYYSFSDRTCCSTCSVAACPLARWSASGVRFDNDTTTMYMYGGINNNDLSFQALQDLWKFNIVTDTWTQMTVTNSITPPRAGSATQALSASSKKRIVVFSGYQQDLASTYTGNDLWMLEEVLPDTWTWTQVMPASFSGPVERASPLSVIVNSFMYVWGGASNNTSVKLAGPMWVLNTTEEDSSLWDWQPLDLAPPKFEPVGLSGPGLVYVPTTRTLTSIGGVITGGSNIAALYRFHPISLLPPLLSVLPDVPNGYDFNLDNDTTHVFNNASPHFSVLSRQSGASVLTTSFGRLVEVTPGGQQVTSFDLSSTNGFLLLYNIFDPQQGFKVTVFTRHAVPGSGTTVSTDAISVRFEFYQYESDTLTDTLPPGSSLTPQQFLIGGGRLKFNVRINDWPFADPQNRLVLSMGFSFPSSIDLSSQATSFGTSYNLSCAEGSLNLNLLNNSVNDDAFQPVGNSITLVGGTNDASLELTFRSFTDSVFYDPDLGVTVTVGASGEDDSGGGTETWVIVVAVVVPVVVVVATIILLGLISVAAFRRRTTRKRVETLSRVQRAATEAEEEPN